MPNTDFTAVPAPLISAFCDTPTSVTYPIENDDIVSMIRSTDGTCSQVVCYWLLKVLMIVCIV